MSDFDLILLYSRAFGAIPYGKQETRHKHNEAVAFPSSTTVDRNTDGPQSVIGKALFQPAWLIIQDGQGNQERFQLPNEPLIEILGGKTLIRTPIDGADGTFKELFANNDYQVTIRGLIVQEDGTDNYPESLVRRLREFCEHDGAILIENDLCQVFDISQIVIESFPFTALEGFPGVQPYQINAWSDKDFEIDLSE